jgi:hypothetical protein
MVGRGDGVGLFAERLVEIFTAAHGRRPADIEELETFIEMQVRWRGRGGFSRPRGYAPRQ